MRAYSMLSPKPIKNRGFRLYYSFSELPVGQEFIPKSDVNLGIVRSFVKDSPFSYTGQGGRVWHQKFKRSLQNPPVKRGYPYEEILCILPENLNVAIKYQEARLNWKNWAKLPDSDED